MLRRKKWVWFAVFIGASLLVGTLATLWNVVIVRDYERLIEASKNLPLHEWHEIRDRYPWLSLVLGSLGFLALLSGLILLFVRLLQEMRLNQLQNEFLASVTHALRTPIATLELCSGLLQKSDLDDKERTTLWRSHAQELHRLKEEVETLLDTARMESTDRATRLSQVELSHWLQTEIPRWQTLLGPEAEPIQVEISSDRPLVHGLLEPQLTKILMDNLIENARKFAKGPPRVCLRLSTQTTRFGRRMWKLEIRDHGWGFDQDQAKKIFGRFVRVKTGAPHAISGTGLGLYLAAMACRMMKLKISGQSGGAGLGALFSIQGRAR
jgi:two-component system sensor histidine kinase ResE